MKFIRIYLKWYCNDVMVMSRLTVFSSNTLCWIASALLFSRCISLFMFSKLFLFCSSRTLQCTCTASIFSASHFLLSSSMALCTWMGACCVCRSNVLKNIAYFRERTIRIHFPRLPATPLHDSLPAPSPVPKISLAALLLPLLAARMLEDHIFKCNPVIYVLIPIPIIQNVHSWQCKVPWVKKVLLVYRYCGSGFKCSR